MVHLQAVDHYLNGEKELRLLKHLCDDDRVSLDVGANIGTYAYFMRRHSRSVICYEPNPKLHHRLSRIYPTLDVRACAVSDCAGTATLTLPITDGRPEHELASLQQSFDDSEAVEHFDVQTVRLDDEDVGDVGFIKIDVERHEFNVLRGAMQLIARCRPKLLTEVTPLLYEQPIPDMFDFITELDYVGWFRFAGRYRPFSEFRQEVHAAKGQFHGDFMAGNVLFLPREDGAAFLAMG